MHRPSDRKPDPSRRDDSTATTAANLPDPSDLWSAQVDEWAHEADRRDDGLNIAFGKY